MEDYYKSLGCRSDATHDELKRAYQKLALEYHPDKQTSVPAGKAEESTEKFIAIDRAWKVLGDIDMRKEYDARWTLRCAAQKWPVQDDVDLADFEWNEYGQMYLYPCRCGGEYTLSQTDTGFGFDYMCCESC